MNVPFVIDAKTGSIRFPDLTLALRPRMTQAEFIAASASLNRDNLGGNDGWQRYSIRAPIAGDRKLGMFLVFLNDGLKTLSFAYAHKDESWDTWTEQAERDRENEYRQELASQLGPTSTFPWGRVQVLLDSKSGGTDIWLHFD